MFSAVLIYVSVYRSSQGPWDQPYPPAAPTCSWYQPRPRETRCRLSARLPLDLNAERLLVLATARELLLCNTSLCLSPFFHHPRSNNSFSNVATCALRFLPVFSRTHVAVTSAGRTVPGGESPVFLPCCRKHLGSGQKSPSRRGGRVVSCRATAWALCASSITS